MEYKDCTACNNTGWIGILRHEDNPLSGHYCNCLRGSDLRYRDRQQAEEISKRKAKQ